MARDVLGQAPLPTSAGASTRKAEIIVRLDGSELGTAEPASLRSTAGGTSAESCRNCCPGATDGPPGCRRGFLPRTPTRFPTPCGWHSRRETRSRCSLRTHAFCAVGHGPMTRSTTRPRGRRPDPPGTLAPVAVRPPAEDPRWLAVRTTRAGVLPVAVAARLPVSGTEQGTVLVDRPPPPEHRWWNVEPPFDDPPEFCDPPECEVPPGEVA